MAKIAYLVVGPESSGTRMLTQYLMYCGAFGDAGHSQRLINLDFSDRPDVIVLRYSLPHARRWPNIAKTLEAMRKHGYAPFPLITIRNKYYMVRSQIAAGHVPNESTASDNIDRAIVMACRTLKDLSPILVSYEMFVTRQDYRHEIARRLGVDNSLAEAKMEFYNANDKYK